MSPSLFTVCCWSNCISHGSSSCSCLCLSSGTGLSLTFYFACLNQVECELHSRLPIKCRGPKASSARAVTGPRAENAMKSQAKLTFACTLFLALLFLVFGADGEKTPSPASPSPSPSAGDTVSTLKYTPPVTTASPPVTAPENSWLLMCDMLHPGKFVFHASVADHGCSLRCIYFDSSHNSSSEYYDVSIQKDHNLNDGIYCRRDHVRLFALLLLAAGCIFYLFFPPATVFLCFLCPLVIIIIDRFAKLATALLRRI